jgi:hypothetical protein
MHGMKNALAEITAIRNQTASVTFRGGAGRRRLKGRIGELDGAVPDTATAGLAGASL